MKKIMILQVIILILLAGNLAYSFDFKNPSNFFSAKEIISPKDRIGEDQIHIYEDKIVIDISGATYAKYADTGSMDPFLDTEANGLEIKPISEEDIQVGDVITYQPGWTSNLVVHRVIQVGEDEQGWYAYTKGDNVSVIDPGKIRFDQVEYILIGVLY
jgi:signal peptidase I